MPHTILQPLKINKYVNKYITRKFDKKKRRYFFFSVASNGVPAAHSPAWRAQAQVWGLNPHFYKTLGCQPEVVGSTLVQNTFRHKSAEFCVQEKSD